MLRMPMSLLSLVARCHPFEVTLGPSGFPRFCFHKYILELDEVRLSLPAVAASLTA